MSWLDEGALFSQVGAFLNEDIGRGDITTQSTVMRSQSAKGRFIAKEAMVVCGLEAAEAVFSTLDSQQQIEAFVADGDEVEAGKVIARTSGFADVLLAGGAEVAVPLEGLIDFAQERARIGREREKQEKELQKAEAQLANPQFVERAPAEKVEELRKRAAEAAGRIKALGEMLEALGE